MGGHLVAALKDAGMLVAGHLWLILAAAVVPVALACITSVVLVMSVELSKRVEAIKALPPVITALNQTATGHLLRTLECRHRINAPEGKPRLPFVTSRLTGTENNAESGRLIDHGFASTERHRTARSGALVTVG
jgi:hypothetical protein